MAGAGTVMADGAVVVGVGMAAGGGERAAALGEHRTARDSLGRSDPALVDNSRLSRFAGTIGSAPLTGFTGFHSASGR